MTNDYPLPENQCEPCPLGVAAGEVQAAVVGEHYLTEETEINAGVQNFLNSYPKDFDNGPDRDSGDIYGPSTPRSLFVGLKLGW